MAKYLRTGPPAHVGLNTPSNSTGFDPSVNPVVQDYQSASFAGIMDLNGNALISAVGYSEADWSVADVYTLIVVSRAAIKAEMKVAPFLPPGVDINTDVAGLSPTWANVKLFYEYVYASLGLVIPDAAIAVLQSATFRTLTNCPAQCSWHALQGYPTPFPTLYANYKTPATRASNTTCNLPNGTDTNTTDWVAVPPSSIDATELGYCNEVWKKAVRDFEAKDPGFKLLPQGCSRDFALGYKMAAALKELLASTSNPVQQAAYVRLFVSFGCQGNFNSLFTGDGYTATGLGGAQATEASEWLFSPFLPKSLAPGGFGTAQFCLGTNGGLPNAAGKCDPSTALP